MENRGVSRVWGKKDCHWQFVATDIFSPPPQEYFQFLIAIAQEILVALENSSALARMDVVTSIFLLKNLATITWSVHLLDGVPSQEGFTFGSLIPNSPASARRPPARTAQPKTTI
jgi:hypothetical protein